MHGVTEVGGVEDGLEDLIADRGVVDEAEEDAQHLHVPQHVVLVEVIHIQHAKNGIHNLEKRNKKRETKRSRTRNSK